MSKQKFPDLRGNPFVDDEVTEDSTFKLDVLNSISDKSFRLVYVALGVGAYCISPVKLRVLRYKRNVKGVGFNLYMRKKWGGKYRREFAIEYHDGKDKNGVPYPKLHYHHRPNINKHREFSLLRKFSGARK